MTKGKRNCNGEGNHRSLPNHEVQYLKMEEPENTKAECILDAINSAFSAFGIGDDYRKKTVGLLLRWSLSHDGSEEGSYKIVQRNKR